ncbi:MAG TPA: magnesium/cobalt transporter CorA [Phycisphaerales bacterium]|nr:magnesium/cobalt transporter CorA [Phycisphaerales bacterium]HMP37617.1 magnesium/cobalt transporter CorA [Phycisphaerales bacterium]
MPRGNRSKRGRKRRLTQNVGTPPGTLVAPPEAAKPEVTVIAYGPEAVVERKVERIDELRELVGAHPVTWINVSGLGDIETIRALGEVFRLHPLAQEDILDLSQRPKLDPYGDRLFLILRMAEIRDGLLLEQMSMFIGPNFVLTFQETPGDCLDELRDRIRRARGRVRRSSASYLGYAIADAVIDGYFKVLERFGDELEELEHRILARPGPELVARLFEIKRELLSVRRAVWPMRDVASQLAHEPDLLDADVRMYARDAHDHAARILDLVESFRELASSMVDIYLANLSNRMNEVIKVLTIISTIFIPLSFVAGIYGMNFDPDVSPWNMPELRWTLGYPFALGIMAAMAATFLIVFWRRGWFGRSVGQP